MAWWSADISRAAADASHDFQPLLQPCNPMGLMDFRPHGCDNLLRFPGNCRSWISLNCSSLAVIHATRPLAPTECGAFLTALQGLLAGRSEIGDGELHRVIRDLQRQYFRPPTDTGTTARA